MKMKYCVILSFIVLLNINTSIADVNYVEHSQTMRVDLYRHEEQENDLSMKWLFGKNNSSWTNDTIPLYRYMNQEFYGQIAVGRPGQLLNVAFDTTWTYTWVLSSECSGLANAGCFYHNKYNHKKSSDYRPDGRKFSVNMGTYNLTGFYSYDNISVSHTNVSNFSFVEIVKVPRSFILTKADGVMGLGLKVDQYDPFFYALVKQKKIRDGIFSVYIDRNLRSNKGGSILLGFIDKNYTRSAVVNGKQIHDEILYLPVDPVSYWRFQMDKLDMIFNSTKNNTFCSGGCKVMIDTSSTGITGPEKEVAEIHKNIQAEKFLFDTYSVKCDRVNSLPKIDFQFGNKSFTFSGPQYITKVSYGIMTVCLSAFQGANTTNWILGTSFLSEVYTIYDTEQRRIGLVHAA